MALYNADSILISQAVFVVTMNEQPWFTILCLILITSSWFHFIPFPGLPQNVGAVNKQLARISYRCCHTVIAINCHWCEASQQHRTNVPLRSIKRVDRYK